MSTSVARRIVNNSPLLYRLLKTSSWHQMRERRAEQYWIERGRPLPPPPAAKHSTLLQYARTYGVKTLVETGTHKGTTLLSLRSHFDRIYSCELDDALHEWTRRLFVHDKHITLIHGDSGERMPEILAELHEPALFWLDAHYSGPGTAQAPLDTPIGQELDLIFRHDIRNHVILIDDARLFGEAADYPSISELHQYVASQRADLTCEVADDIIRILPKHHMPLST